MFLFSFGNFFFFLKKNGAGSQGGEEVQANSASVEICSNHEECEPRPGQMKLTKGFSAKEPVKGHMASSFFSILKFI